MSVITPPHINPTAGHTTPTALSAIKKYSTVVADTADFALLEKFYPEDATTNPSLVLAGSKMDQYQYIITDAVAKAKANHPHNAAAALEDAFEHVTVMFGCEILKIVPGRVSTEVDAKYSFNVDMMIKKAHKLIQLYKEAGYGKERIYIKVAATWEGIQAAKKLETEGINCNLTLLFSFAQALACAQVNVTLISPFVGRIMDYYQKKSGKDYSQSPEEDPGVVSVTRIFNYYKLHNYKTIVMGASFRNVGEILQLVGCDKITISPKLLETLEQMSGADCQLFLNAKHPKVTNEKDKKKYSDLTYSEFMLMHNQDPMAVTKLAEGIAGFDNDARHLEKYLQSLM